MKGGARKALVFTYRMRQWGSERKKGRMVMKKGKEKDFKRSCEFLYSCMSTE